MTGPAAPRARIQPAAERVLRVLSIVPWIAAHDGPRIDDVCARFGVTRRRLLEDLNVLQFVGLPPYTPDMLTEVTFSGDRVWVRLADVFSRPLRLTPDQALGLVAAGAALTSTVAGDPDRDIGPLGTGLAKLARVLDIDPSEAVSIHLGASNPGVLQTLNQAVRERHQVRIDYFTYSRDARTTRDVDPYRVFAEGGAWYLHGHCHAAGKPRLFRLDRIFALTPLDTRFDRPAAADGVPAVFEADADAPRVTLRLAPAARWVVEQYPVESTTAHPDGEVEVRLAVSSRAWLEKLLLRLGPDARIVEATDPGLRHAGRDAARRVLARYRRSGEG